MATIIETDFLTVREAAAALGVPQSAVRRWIARGDLPAYRVGQRRLAVRRADLTRLRIPAQAVQGDNTRPVGRSEECPERRPLSREEQDRARAAVAGSRALQATLLQNVAANRSRLPGRSATSFATNAAGSSRDLLQIHLPRSVHQTQVVNKLSFQLARARRLRK